MNDLNTPNISVVVCTFNLRSSLAQLLEGLNNQTYPYFELILVDNGPFPFNKNHLEASVSPYHFPIKIVSQHKNLGPGRGRNFGVQHTSFNVIAFIDDDCIPDRNWLEIIKREIINSHKKIIVGDVYSTIFPCPPFIHAFLINPYTKVFMAGNCAFTKDWFLYIGGFDEFLNNWAEDFEIGEKSILNGVDFEFIKDMRVNHPPVLRPYQLADHLMTYNFLKKYFYIIRYKQYQYKHHLLFHTIKKALIKLSFCLFFLLLPLPHFFGNILIPILLFNVHSAFKVIKVKKLIKAYPFSKPIPARNFLYFILTFWAIDLFNLIYLTTFLIYAKLFPDIYSPNK
ncbi:MAG: hypothetical protein A2381_04415 [Bdellovibrionales bacterium RIFOXYB1_FULL_37_110]|nr:MAG: hypothetical protein A2417_15995 [Bdellovibrionales bacterium RIFOXYC1_FULL_37_79]OFZ57411.1 MAG: hypothetical protein A2381_04415 [Bdellovibrionales bacterium RIFOXYB1_FULL_37_110]OFZ62263.1 MAG: hypothetical protein A2577_12935 [Bdellovibrionales bacterium RIFOXYD1_FULL_36_51]